MYICLQSNERCVISSVACGTWLEQTATPDGGLYLQWPPAPWPRLPVQSLTPSTDHLYFVDKMISRDAALYTIQWWQPALRAYQRWCSTHKSSAVIPNLELPCHLLLVRVNTTLKDDLVRYGLPQVVLTGNLSYMDNKIVVVDVREDYMHKLLCGLWRRVHYPRCD
jgi:hypothetical protein